MAFQKVEFEFPDDDGDEEIEIAPSSAETLGKPKGDPELEIEVVDDTPEEDRGRVPSDPPEEVTDEELEGYSKNVQSRIKKMTKSYHDERRAKEAALRERQELEAYARKLVEENANLKGTVGKSESAMLEQAKRSVAAELLAAKDQYRKAYEAGDTDAVIEAQESLTNAKLRADKLSNYRPRPLQEQQSPVKMSSQTENPAPARPVDARAAQWAKDNTWFNSDPEMTSVALGYHQKLVKEQGLDPQSDEYYNAIDKRMRKLFPENFEDEVESSKGTTRRQSSNVVAPATRSTAPRKVRLTQTQVAIAKKLGVPLELYAKQVAEEMRK